MRKLFLFFFVCILASHSFSQIYPSSSRTITYTDAARSNRSVAVEFHYPATVAGSSSPVATDSFPFIVFGHGFQMTASAYSPYYDSLSQLGFILAFPTTESTLSPSHPSFAQDLIFVYNTLLTENSNSSSPFYHKVKSKGAIAGHSMGGGATVLSASYSNPATCYFTFAAANTTPSAITASSAMTKPYLDFAGSYDCIAPYATNQLPMYDSSASPCKHLVEITGASHCHFGVSNFQCDFGEGVSGCASPPLSRVAQVNTTLSYLIPYLNYYLKDICADYARFDSVFNADAGSTHQTNCVFLSVIPLITQSGDTLTSGLSGTAYQWFYNGQLLSNSNSIFIVATHDGNYKVSVSYGVPCPAVSSNYLFQHTSITNIAENKVQIYPNPIYDVLNMEADEPITISIIDALGRTVAENKELSSKKMINTATLSGGIYTVQIKMGGETLTKKIVKAQF